MGQPPTFSTTVYSATTLNVMELTSIGTEHRKDYLRICTSLIIKLIKMKAQLVHYEVNMRQRYSALDCMTCMYSPIAGYMTRGQTKHSIHVRMCDNT